VLSDLHSVACIGLHLHLDWIRACGRYSCMAGSSSAVAAFTEMVRSEVLSGGSQCCARGPARTHSTCTTRELGGTGHRAQDLRWDGATTAPHRGSSLPPASRQSCTASPAGMGWHRTASAVHGSRACTLSAAGQDKLAAIYGTHEMHREALAGDWRVSVPSVQPLLQPQPQPLAYGSRRSPGGVGSAGGW
jgi:hypothetical protein